MTETAVVRVVLGYSSLTALGTEKTWKKSAHFLEKICYQPFKITIKVQIPLDTCAVKPELLSLCCITSDMTCESTLVVSSGLVGAGTAMTHKCWLITHTTAWDWFWKKSCLLVLGIKGYFVQCV